MRRSLGDRVDQAAELLERERELERISRAPRDAVDGVGSVLLVEGPAGIGKTTLALAAGAQGRSRGARLLRAAGRELERDFPYGVVRQLFDPVLRAAGPAHRENSLTAVRTALEGLCIGYSVATDQPGRFYDYPGDPVVSGVGTPVSHTTPA
jgi:hypothetical protein